MKDTVDPAIVHTEAAADAVLYRIRFPPVHR